jgi:hypothetical protein
VNNATALASSAIWKIVPLIVTATFFLLAACAASYVLTKQNPQWSRARRYVVHSALVFTAAAACAVFFVFRWRSGS